MIRVQASADKSGASDSPVVDADDDHATGCVGEARRGPGEPPVLVLAPASLEVEPVALKVAGSGTVEDRLETGFDFFDDFLRLYGHPENMGRSAQFSGYRKI